MATVVNLFPDRRSELIGQGLGKAIGKRTEERRLREQQEAQQRALQLILENDSEQMDDQTALARLVSAQFDIGDATEILNVRKNQEKTQKTQQGLEEFFGVINRGGTPNQAFEILGPAGFMTPEVLQTLSQSGFGRKENRIKVTLPDGTEQDVFFPGGAQANEESLNRYAPSLFAKGAVIGERPKATGSDKPAKPTDKDKQISSFLINRGIEVNERTIAKANEFVNQRENVQRDIDKALGRFEETVEGTVELIVEPGLSMDIANEAKALVADVFIQSDEFISPRRAAARSLAEARERVEGLKHLPGSSMREKLREARNRNWSRQEIVDAMAKQGILERADKEGKTVAQLIDEIWGNQ